MKSSALFLTGLLSLAAIGDVAGQTFVEASRDLGLEVVHRHYGTGEKYMPENMGPGVALLDFDFDGRVDLFVPGGAPLGPSPALAGDAPFVGRLLRQSWDGRFVDVSERAGVPRLSSGSGMGVTYADLDGDGALEIFVSRFGSSRLLVGREDGTFVSASAGAGAAGLSFAPSPGWGTGCGFVDVDRDGDLDLYEAHYVDFSYDNHRWCGDGKRDVRSYCHPDVYRALPDRLYVHEGPGLVERAARLGLVPSEVAKGLGVAFADFDGDEVVDILVANDSTRNQLYLNDGQGHFTDGALLAGLGYNASGQAEASMGIALGDTDDNGFVDVLLTHLDQETHTLYSGSRGGVFADVTERRGLAAATLPWVGFGTDLLDLDHDGDLDLAVANGHIIDNIESFDRSRSYRQPFQLFLNDGSGRFESVASGLTEPIVGRGLASGDLDRDGDLDLVVAQNNDRLLVLVNSAPALGESLVLELRGASRNRLGLGAELELEHAGRVQRRRIAAGGSYLSQGEAIAHFGLGGPALEADSRRVAKGGELRLRWPKGRQVVYRGLNGGRRLTLFENN